MKIMNLYNNRIRDAYIIRTLSSTTKKRFLFDAHLHVSQWGRSVFSFVFLEVRMTLPLTPVLLISTHKH